MSVIRRALAASPSRNRSASASRTPQPWAPHHAPPGSCGCSAQHSGGGALEPADRHRGASAAAISAVSARKRRGCAATTEGGAAGAPSAVQHDSSSCGVRYTSEWTTARVRTKREEGAASPSRDVDRGTSHGSALAATHVRASLRAAATGEEGIGGAAEALGSTSRGALLPSCVSAQPSSEHGTTRRSQPPPRRALDGEAGTHSQESASKPPQS